MGGSFGVGLVSVVLLFACSSSGGSTSTASGFAQQYCALLEPCCADAGLSTSGQQCQELVGASAGYNASAGQACLDAVKQAQGQPGFCATGGANGAACKSVFSSSSRSGGSGTAQPGQPCTLDGDCAAASGGGAICLGYFSGSNNSMQVCVQTQAGVAGQGPCVGDVSASSTLYSWSGSAAPPALGYTCDNGSGLTCDSTTRKCVAQSTAGQPCTGDGSCIADDYCNFGAASGSICAARVADGTSCAGTQASACETTSYCDSVSQVCTAGLADGSPCTTSDPCQGHVCSNGKCGASSSLGLALLCGG